MKQRIITAAIGIALFIPVIVFSNTWVYPAVMAILAAVAAFELLRCVGIVKKWFFSIPAIILVVAMPLTIRLFLIYPASVQHLFLLVFLS